MNATAALLGSCAEGRLALQPLWDAVLRREAWLAWPLFPALFSFTAYMACCAPFLALDCLRPRLRLLQRYKLQPAAASPSAAVAAACAARSLRDHLLGILPATVLRGWWSPVRLPGAAPELPRLVLDVAACLLLFDGLFFLWHVLHHRVPWLYRTFHKAHHRHVAAFALSTQDSSPWELLWLGFFGAALPLLLGCHPLTEMSFHLLNIWLSVEDHSGYDLPCATHRLVPFGLYGGAPHHDLHHLKFKVNYAPYFTHWDRLLGTLCRAEGAPAKKAAAD